MLIFLCKALSWPHDDGHFLFFRMKKWVNMPTNADGDLRATCVFPDRIVCGSRIKASEKKTNFAIVQHLRIGRKPRQSVEFKNIAMYYWLSSMIDKLVRISVRVMYTEMRDFFREVTLTLRLKVNFA